MNKESLRNIFISILISAVAIMIMSNMEISFYNKYFLYPVLIQLATYIFLINKNKIEVNEKGYIYLIPILLIIFGTLFLTQDPSNIVLNIFIIPTLLSFLYFSLMNKEFKITGNFLKLSLKLYPKKLFSNLSNIKININKNIIYVIAGLIISVPFILVIMSLLRSADLYFSSFTDSLNSLFENIFDIDNVKKNIIVLLFYFISLYSTFINIINNKENIEEPQEKKDFNEIISNTVLIMINLVYVLFIISETSKLTGNFLELPEKYTYAEYAREGFFQLLLVTFINIGIIFFYIYKTALLEKNKSVKKLLGLLITFTIILIINSFYRMYLYMHTFGFTILRTQVILYLIMELILLIVIIKKVFSKLKHDESSIFTPVMITTYVLNILICNEEVITFINRLINKG